jgi:superfamily II DNA/RNA helicase
MNPTYVLFSATVDDETIKLANFFINQPTASVYAVKKEALKLENIKQLKIKMADDLHKRKFLE